MTMALRSKHGWIAAGMALALVAARTQVLAEDQPSLAGFWYGIGEPDDPAIFYIDYFHADGTFNSEYRKCEKGKLVYQQTQSGKWSVANGVLTMNSDYVNGKPDSFDHFYRIESVTALEVHARLFSPDYLFVETRIPAFEFPPCYLGS
jgi:hypothetical protein